MIASGYDLQLYCDANGCQKGASNFHPTHHEYTGDETGSAARAKARRDGWKLNTQLGLAICPGCAKEGRKPTPNGILRKANRK